MFPLREEECLCEYTEDEEDTELDTEEMECCAGRCREEEDDELRDMLIAPSSKHSPVAALENCTVPTLGLCFLRECLEEEEEDNEVVCVAEVESSPDDVAREGRSGSWGKYRCMYCKKTFSLLINFSVVVPSVASRSLRYHSSFLRDVSAKRKTTTPSTSRRIGYFLLQRLLRFLNTSTGTIEIRQFLRSNLCFRTTSKSEFHT